MNKDSKIYVAGHNGMVGSAIVRKLKELGYTKIITKSRKELDLTNQFQVNHFFHFEKPEYVFLAAAKVGGIKSNEKMCQDFNKQYGTNYISVMPTNLYGPNDNYDLNNSHVLPALIRKFHEAKIENKDKVEIWGTGSPMREFLYVDDLAQACHYLMLNHNGSEIINVGTGKDISIKDLAYIVKDVLEYEGDIYFNTDMPDGTPRKLLDISKILELGWEPKTGLRTGIKKTYLDYVK